MPKNNFHLRRYKKFGKGLSPDDLWNQSNIIKRTADKDSLKLCCMRSSKTMTIGRHGIRDSEFGVTYFDEWLWNHPRAKVYLRRDPRDFNEAWVFNADTDEYLGKAFIRKPVAAFAETPIEKEQLKQAIGIRRKQLKLEKEPGASVIRQSTDVILENMVAAAQLFGNNVEEQNQNVSELVRTPFDSVALNQRATKKAQQYKNDYEARILSATWATDQQGRKIKPILKLDSDFDYYDEHKEEILKMVNG
nr:Mu transposase C-terminal domain-containing protein [Alphaproteobacteria bacterium]